MTMVASNLNIRSTVDPLLVFFLLGVQRVSLDILVLLVGLTMNGQDILRVWFPCMKRPPKCGSMDRPPEANVLDVIL